MPLYNPRVIPQQSVLMFSSISDIGAFIKKEEKGKKKKYLTAIKISSKEKQTVLRELHSIGVHAGSLSPGLDGVCKSLKERNFIFA